MHHSNRFLSLSLSLSLPSSLFLAFSLSRSSLTHSNTPHQMCSQTCTSGELSYLVTTMMLAHPFIYILLPARCHFYEISYVLNCSHLFYILTLSLTQTTLAIQLLLLTHVHTHTDTPGHIPCHRSPLLCMDSPTPPPRQCKCISFPW